MSEPVERSARGVSAAEKYAEVGDGRPLCECHGEIMYWIKNSSHIAGGVWQCRVPRVTRSTAWNRVNAERRNHLARCRRSTPGTNEYKKANLDGSEKALHLLGRRIGRRNKENLIDDLMIAQLETKLKGAA